MDNLILLKILAILANTGDYVTTIIGIKFYMCRERNPIARWLLKVPILAFIIKIGFNFIIWNSSDHFLWICIVLFGFCCINNYIKIIKMRRIFKWVKNRYNLSSSEEVLRYVKGLKRIYGKN